MRKLLTQTFLLLILLLSANAIKAGDTTWVSAHQDGHWNWYGAIDQWIELPSDPSIYERILLRYELGCPGQCSDWDYTTQIIIRHRNGDMDSTVAYYPQYTVDGFSDSTLYYSLSSTYIYYYDSINQTTDSVQSSLVWYFEYADNLNPGTPTDSAMVYPAGYFNYVYDSMGTVTDSVWANPTSTLTNTYHVVYTPFEVVEHFEMARIITPYGGNLQSPWNRVWYFDVTDFMHLLTDSVEIRGMYGGWSDGFTITTDFLFIEGTPNRNVIDIQNLYSSGMGGFQYGNVNNPIENHLNLQTIDVPANASGAKLRFTASGHSFGGNENCAEFCVKNYYVNVDGNAIDSQAIWRDDCGLNALYPQAGTWLYDRAGWCPGEKTIIWEHDLGDHITAGGSLNIDLDIDPYTYLGGAGFHPNYIVESQIVFYEAENFTNDAMVSEIISPNTDFHYNRFNPICGQPEVVIKNNGSANLQTLNIYYGVVGNAEHHYQWTGNLSFLESEDVVLPAFEWGYLANTDKQFYVRVDNPNGNADEYDDNNRIESEFEIVERFPAEIRLQISTNNAGFENSWDIKDDNDSVLYSDYNMFPQFLYNEVLNFDTGCYTFTCYDSDGDGMSFFANNDGGGFIRFFDNQSGFAIEFLEENFGSQISKTFTVGYSMDSIGTAVDTTTDTTSDTIFIGSVKSINTVNVYPNPASEYVNIKSMIGLYKVQLFDQMGALIYEQDQLAGSKRYAFAIDKLAAGLYSWKVFDKKNNVSTGKLHINER